MADTDYLKESIMKDAEAEGAKLLEEAEKAAAQKKSLSQGQIKKIQDEASRKAGEQCAAIRQAAESAAALLSRKSILKVQDEMWNRVLGRVRKGLEDMTDKSAYRELLKSFLIEGAVGLAEPRAVYNATEKELKMIDAALLREASGQVKALTGLDVEFIKSGNKPLTAQGVVIYSENKRLMYNNQIPTRISRIDTDIRKLIAKELYD